MPMLEVRYIPKEEFHAKKLEEVRRIVNGEITVSELARALYLSEDMALALMQELVAEMPGHELECP